MEVQGKHLERNDILIEAEIDLQSHLHHSNRKNKACDLVAM